MIAIDGEFRISSVLKRDVERPARATATPSWRQRYADLEDHGFVVRAGQRVCGDGALWQRGFAREALWPDWRQQRYWSLRALSIEETYFVGTPAPAGASTPICTRVALIEGPFGRQVRTVAGATR